MTPMLTLQGLTKRYGTTEAVRDLSLTVARGEVFGLLGANGAGKTTTLECIAGLRTPDAGDIYIGDVNARTESRRARAGVGIALQAAALPDQATPREALQLFASLYTCRVDPDQLLRRFGLLERADSRVYTLSAGQQQRLGLALALVHAPELLILDEPTAGLDPAARRALQAEIIQLRSEGRTVLISTHDLGEAQHLCDRVGILRRGRLVACGPPQTVTAAWHPLHTVTLSTDPSLDAATFAAFAGCRVEVSGDTLMFSTADRTGFIAALPALLAAHGAIVRELHVSPASLESAFLEGEADAGKDIS